MLAAVLDTNVLISAYGWRETPGRCLDLLRAGRFRGITCRELLEELRRKLAAVLGYSDQEADETLADLLRHLDIVEIRGAVRGACGDPDDDAVLERALAGGATHIVTGDRKHLLPLGAFQGIPIVTPTAFVREMEALESPPTP